MLGAQYSISTAIKTMLEMSKRNQSELLASMAIDYHAVIARRPGHRLGQRWPAVADAYSGQFSATVPLFLPHISQLIFDREIEHQLRTHLCYSA